MRGEGIDKVKGEARKRNDGREVAKNKRVEKETREKEMRNKEEEWVRGKERKKEREEKKEERGAVRRGEEEKKKDTNMLLSSLIRAKRPP